MSRGALRVAACFGLLAVSVAFIFCMPDYVLKASYTAPGEGIPVCYLGYFLAVLGILGLCGVNVFLGGPLDKRKDPLPTRDDLD